jgi:hypothetical protein
MIRTNVVRLAAAVMTLTAVTAGAQQTATLPAAATLIAKYAEAIGAPAIMKAPQITTKGALTMPAAGLTAAFEMVQVAPNKMQMMTTIPGVGAIQVGFDGTTGWSVDPMQGPRLLAGKELDEIREQADPRATGRSPELFSAVQTVADTTMGGEQCYMVKLTWKSGRETFDCYSGKTGLMVGSKSVQQTAMGAIPVEMIYSEYKKFGDFMMPTKMVQSLMGQQQVTTILGVEVAAVPGVVITMPAEIKALKK